ncbi:transposable element Tcb2 transposase [Trichonephila clavipes]|nr:transposable element Tcb2 transposase [Trichonephila clavipes]
MLGSRTDLQIFDAGSVNGTRYCNEILLPYVRLFRGAMGLQFLFMDDNAPCHRTVAAEQLLESRRLAARTLPPVTIRELQLALQDKWAAMLQQLIDTLILSMGRCCETCQQSGEIISPTKDRMFLAGHPSQGSCQQVNSGVSAIFGPQNPLLGSHIQSLCDALDIPHIEARLDVESEVKEFSINLYPSPWLLGKAIRDLTKYLNWTKVAIIYEDDSDEVEKLAYQLNEEAERTERPIRRLSKVMYGSTCADTQVDVMGECLSSIKHVVGTTSGCFYPSSNLWEVGGRPQCDKCSCRVRNCSQHRFTTLETISNYRNSYPGFSSGRPRGTTPADDRYIVLQARRNRRQTAGEIAINTTQATGRPISRFTVARRLHGGGLFARRPVRCVPLTPSPIGEGVPCGAGNTGIGETMNGDEYFLQMRADSV